MPVSSKSVGFSIRCVITSSSSARGSINQTTLVASAQYQVFGLSVCASLSLFLFPEAPYSSCYSEPLWGESGYCPLHWDRVRDPSDAYADKPPRAISRH